MIFKPAHTYPTDYDISFSQINLQCFCHPRMISATARRCGLVVTCNSPVYKITSRVHPEYNNVRIALTRRGLRNPIRLLKEATI
jgi:hypothetical protein